MVRRIVRARVGGHPAAEDLIRETLTGVLAASPTIEDGMLEPYAIVTARNVIASMWRDVDRHKRNEHRVVDLRQPDAPDDQMVLDEEQSAVAAALARLSDREREALVAHEVSGKDTHSLAAESQSTAGAIAARLQSHASAACGSSTSWHWRRPSRPLNSADRSSSPSPAAIAGANARWTPLVTSSAAHCARLGGPLAGARPDP